MTLKHYEVIVHESHLQGMKKWNEAAHNIRGFIILAEDPDHARRQVESFLRGLGQKGS